MPDHSSGQVLFSWLHLSDIHVGHGSVSHGWDQHTVLTKLQQDVEECLASTVCFPRPNVVFITGDVAFSANAKQSPPMAQDGEYVGATRWLDALLKSVGLQRKDVYLVPGNHDVQRKVDEEDEDIHRLVDAVRSEARPEDSLDAVLQRERSRARLERRLANYLEFATGFAPECAKDTDGRARLFWQADLDVPGLRPYGLELRLVGLNTVLVGGRKDDQGKLRVGRQQLICLDSVKDRLVIALSHHPTDWLADREHVEQVLRGAKAIHLCGHVHDQKTETLRSGTGGELLTVVAGAVHADEHDDDNDPVGHGYSFGALLVVDGRLVVRVWPRLWERGNHRFHIHGKGTKNNEFYAEHDLRKLPGTGPEPPTGLDVHKVQPSLPPPRRPTLDTTARRPFADLVQQGYPLDLPVAERERYLTLADRVLTAVHGHPNHLDLSDHLEAFINQGPDTARASTALAAWRDALVTCGADASTPVSSASSADPLKQIVEALLPHHDTLRSGMRGLFTRMPDSTAAGPGMFDMLRDEMQRHRERFVGREELLRDLTQRLLAPAPRPLCITGSEGRGKSALLSALIWRLAKGHKLLGPVSVSAQQACPWLPACLLHFGKKSRDPVLILHSLLEQANALLMQPIIVPARELSELGMGTVFLHHERLVPSSRWQRGDQLEALYATGAPQAAQRDTSHVERLRGTLHAALVRLVEERGQTLLVVDALDEISRDGTGLEFLPDVPAGVGVLLSTRPHQSILEGIESRFRPQRVDLPGLSAEDIATITGVSDQSWIEQVREHTQGTPLVVQVIALQAHEHGHKSLDIRFASQAVYEGQVRRWRSAGCAEAGDQRYQVLRLLAVLEPVQPVPLSAVQGFLDARGVPCSQNELRTFLDVVSDQIEGLQANRVKLAAESLANHVRRTTLSDRDLRALLGEVADWLLNDTQVESAILARFVATWTDERFNDDSEARSRVLGVLQTLRERGARERLFGIWRSGWSAEERTSPVAQACLQAAADLEHPKAMRILGYGLLYDKNASEASGQAETWLRKAAEHGDPTAMGMLGTHLLDGDRLAKDPEQGEHLLRKAAALEEPRAMAVLGSRLLDGAGLQADLAEGESWLRKAADLGELQAMAILGSRLLDGEGLQTNPAEGERWLRKAADLGELQAMTVLGNRLLDGDGLQTDPAEGEEWLRKAADLGELQAMTVLGERLLNGASLPTNPAKGEEWLRKAADLGDVQAMAVLGSRLLKGDGLQADPAEGEEWLRKAADLGDVQAMAVLGSRLLKGDGLQADPAEGEEWLRKAADLGELQAMRVLGIRLLDGYGLQADPAKGERWLRKAADLGDVQAMRNLGRHLLDGLQADPAEGEEWLRKAVDLGDIKAMAILGSHLLEGVRLQADPAEGERWLRKAADLGDAQAMAVLGSHLLEGVRLQADPAEGERWLRNAADHGNAQAMRVLGNRLLDGNGLLADPAEGEKWLRKAADLGDIQTMRNLGSRLLDGDGLQADPAESEKWLRKAADLGDVQAMAVLGSRLFKGGGLLADPAEGERWLRKAADLGDAQAMAVLGSRLLKGDGLLANPAEGERWLRKATDLGDAQAMRVLGNRLLDGDGLQANPAEGEKWLRKAADLDDVQAMASLGSRLLDGVGLLVDSTEGEQWLRKAADLDDVQAMANLGSRLLDGIGLLADSAEGERWLRKAADLGDLKAMRTLGDHLLDGDGLQADPAEGERWLRKAADLDDPFAMGILGVRLLDGDGLQADPAEGEIWLRKAEGKHYPGTRHQLGFHLYARARANPGAVSARAEAGRLFVASLKEEHEEPGVSLAYMIRRGEFPAAEAPPVTKLLAPGLKTKLDVALVNKALVLAAGYGQREDWGRADGYMHRLGKASNVVSAITWWRRSAELGDVEGDLVLAWLARHGVIEMSDIEMHSRFKRAAQQGWHVPDWLYNRVSQTSSPKSPAKRTRQARSRPAPARGRSRKK